MHKPTLAITLGDPAGTGAELAVRASRDDEVRDACQLAFVGRLADLERARRAIGESTPIRVVDAACGGLHHPDVLVLLDTTQFDATPVRPGVPDAAAGRVALAALSAGVDLVTSGAVQGLVTAPVGKKALVEAGFEEGVGQTAFIQKKLAVGETAMLLIHGKVRASHLTTHVPLSTVPRAITEMRTRHILSVTAEGLRDMGIAEPRMALAGINPHAGEDGVLGVEEERALMPAIRWARANGLRVDGVFPNETVWALRDRYDVIVCAYHDAGHVPLRILAGNQGVHLTLGLGFPRGAPLHGTAYKHAGAGTADPTAMRNAIIEVARIARRGQHRSLRGAESRCDS
ncbi:MAG: 4-hydroxythreonine-4-phosphate dehydrogenase PdxA [Deltaproteobacteria bacterium]|nr:4-hydroxythreonine-4-phosphate dehydrogenase PdxA [Deltaproteobacteria bacterium]